MKAIWLENNVLSFRQDVPPPTPSEIEALVRVRMAGICGTDLELIKGYYRYSGIPGHEFVGDIIEAPQQPQRIGERVVGDINVSCGTCSSCSLGQPMHCETRKILGIKGHHGVLAEYVCLPLKNLISVPDSVSDDAAVFVEPLAAALEIQSQIEIQPQHQVLVVGAGRLGQLIAQTLAVTECRLQVVARYQKQKQLLTAHNITWIDETSATKRLYDVVVEATGSPSGFAIAHRAVRPRGIIVLKSTYQSDVSINLSSIVVDEVTLMGSRCGSLRPALDLIERGIIHPVDLIEKCYLLKQAPTAFEHAAKPGVLKILVKVVD